MTRLCLCAFLILASLATSGCSDSASSTDSTLPTQVATDVTLSS